MRKLLDYTMTSGRHRVVWDGRSDDGLVLRTGVYFVSLHTGVNVSYDGSCFCDEGCGRLTGATATGYIPGPCEPAPIDLDRRKLSLRLDGSSPICELA